MERDFPNQHLRKHIRLRPLLRRSLRDGYATFLTEVEVRFGSA
jgi:hypothetical protein